MNDAEPNSTMDVDQTPDIFDHFANEPKGFPTENAEGNKTGNLESFSQDLLIKEILLTLEKNCRSSANLLCDSESFSADLKSLFDQKFPEISAVEVLQVFESTLVAEPEISFSKSGLRFDEYIRRKFSLCVSRGYLPLANISDHKLRRRVSVEKSRNNFPDDLDRICLTQNECSELRKEAVAVISGGKNMTSTRLLTFAKNLMPQIFR